MKRYIVKVRDTHNNVTVMSEHYTEQDALEEEAVLCIQNPEHHIWIESNTYWEGE